MDFVSDLPSHIKYITTGLGSLMAIIGLFIDKNSAHFKYIAPFFIALICILGFFQANESINADKDTAFAMEQRNQLLLLVDNASTASMRTSSYLTDILLSQPKILKDFGLTESRAGKPLEQISTSDLVTGEILAANKYRMELIEQKPPSQRLHTRLWYYNKEMDTPELNNALKEIGFTVENKVATQRMADDPTNAIWYGPEVEFLDYKAVIVSMIRAGIDIRRTGPSCQNLENKKGVIEIGSSNLASGHIDGIARPAKSISEIRAAKSFADIQDFNC